MWICHVSWAGGRILAGRRLRRLGIYPKLPCEFIDADRAPYRQATGVAAIRTNKVTRRWCTIAAMREPVMLREDAGGGGRPSARNVLGER
ncbi:MAG TPA: hypothetical protein VNH18_08030, partial [Bryobacteraceae bacterium]|nr:hypothetical protein [Bryobacteraceae bacterium]